MWDHCPLVTPKCLGARTKSHRAAFFDIQISASYPEQPGSNKGGCTAGNLCSPQASLETARLGNLCPDTSGTGRARTALLVCPGTFARERHSATLRSIWPVYFTRQARGAACIETVHLKEDAKPSAREGAWTGRNLPGD